MNSTKSLDYFLLIVLYLASLQYVYLIFSETKLGLLVFILTILLAIPELKLGVFDVRRIFSNLRLNFRLFGLCFLMIAFLTAFSAMNQNTFFVAVFFPFTIMFYFVNKLFMKIMAILFGN